MSSPYQGDDKPTQLQHWFPQEDARYNVIPGQTAPPDPPDEDDYWGEEEEPPEQRNWRKIILWSLGALVALLVAFAAFTIFLGTRNPQPVGGTDGATPPPAVATKTVTARPAPAPTVTVTKAAPRQPKNTSKTTQEPTQMPRNSVYDKVEQLQDEIAPECDWVLQTGLRQCYVRGWGAQIGDVQTILADQYVTEELAGYTYVRGANWIVFMEDPDDAEEIMQKVGGRVGRIPGER